MVLEDFATQRQVDPEFYNHLVLHFAVLEKARMRAEYVFHNLSFFLSLKSAIQLRCARCGVPRPLIHIGPYLSKADKPEPCVRCLRLDPLNKDFNLTERFSEEDLKAAVDFKPLDNCRGEARVTQKYPLIDLQTEDSIFTHLIKSAYIEENWNAGYAVLNFRDMYAEFDEEDFDDFDDDDDFGTDCYCTRFCPYHSTIEVEHRDLDYTNSFGFLHMTYCEDFEKSYKVMEGIFDRIADSSARLIKVPAWMEILDKIDALGLRLVGAYSGNNSPYFFPAILVLEGMATGKKHTVFLSDFAHYALNTLENPQE